MDIASKFTHPIFTDFTQTELEYLFEVAKTLLFKKESVLEVS